MITEEIGITLELVDPNAPPDEFMEGIDEEGIVEDLPIETYYCSLKTTKESDGYFRIVGDNGFTDVEIRIPFELLESLGWQKISKPTPSKDCIDDGFGSSWSIFCPTCKRPSMHVVRPGDAQCSYCG